MFTIFAGIYHWFPKITGRMYDERLGRVHFWLTLVGVFGTFIPMHSTGMEGCPAEWPTLRPVRRLEPVHLLLRVPPRRRPAGLPLQHDRQLALRPEGGAEPWRAKTIEWQVSSPPPVFNFDEIPRVVGGPYEFGVPGARHVIMPGEESEVREPQKAGGGPLVTEKNATTPGEEEITTSARPQSTPEVVAKRESRPSATRTRPRRVRASRGS